MPQNSPTFSIVIPTYNRAHLINKTIESMLRQEFQDFEILVVDDGSKDNTGEVIKTFTDSRIQYFRKENAERGAARNYGATRAKGTYINFFDSDDLMYANHLSEANKLIASKDSPEFFHLGYDYKSVDGTVTARVDNFDDSVKTRVLFDNILSCNGVFVRRDIAIQFPFEEDRVLASSEDWELWIRLVSRYKLHYANAITSSVVNHDQRSLRTIEVQKIVARDLFLIDRLKGDAAVMSNYGGTFDRFAAERYTFFMLCFAEQKKKSDVMKWGKRAFKTYPMIMLTKRFLSAVKNNIFK